MNHLKMVYSHCKIATSKLDFQAMGCLGGVPTHNGQVLCAYGAECDEGIQESRNYRPPRGDNPTFIAGFPIKASISRGFTR